MTFGTPEDGSASGEFTFWHADDDGNVPESPALTLPDAGLGSAAFDSSGVFVAAWYTPFDSEGQPGWPEMIVTDMVQVRPVDATVAGFAWHPSEPVLAYIAFDPETGKRMLYRSEPVSDGSGPIDATLIAEVPSEARLVGWGDWGYMIEARHLTAKGPGEFGEEYDVQRATYLLDPDGVPVIGAPVQVAAINAFVGFMLVEPGVTSTLTLTGDPEDYGLLAYDTGLIDFEGTGLTATGVRFDPIEIGRAAEAFLDDYIERSDTAFILSPDARAVLVIDFAQPDERTLETPVHVVELTEGQIHTLTITAPNPAVVGFGRSGRYIVYSNGVAGTIQMLDWETGTQYGVFGITVPIQPDDEMPEGLELVAALFLA